MTKPEMDTVYRRFVRNAVREAPPEKPKFLRYSLIALLIVAAAVIIGLLTK